tara:strand:+ start:1569 stop:2744 length:1176 start_codon:yes stop_codon:yes gene_type:complete
MKYLQLTELAELINGSTPLKSNKKFWDNGTINWFTAEDLRNGSEVINTNKFITKYALDNTSIKLVPKDSVLLCCTASIGLIGINKIELTTNQQFNAIVPNKELINFRYLFYFLKSYMSEFEKKASTTTVGFISQKKVKSILVPVPSIQEQEEIVARLDKVFNHISTQAENIKTQMNLNSLIFESYFEKIQSNFINSGTISEFFDLATGGTPSKKNKDYFDNGNIPWLLSGDIHQENISESKNFITEDGLKNSNAKYLPIGSVLIALNGQGKTRGTVAQLKINATCNQSLVSINSKDNNVIENEFLFYFLKSQYKKIRKLTGDSGNDRRGLNMNIINSMKIKFPEISVQKKIIDNCKSLSEVNKNLTKILDSKKYKYAELKSSLLNKEFVHE